MANYREETKAKTQKHAVTDTIPDVDATPAHRCPHTPQPVQDCGHQVLKVDRACLQCSGNMSQVMAQIKLACLSYS